MTTAKEGDTVHVHYKGSLENGEVFDTSEGRDPLSFTVGTGQVIPGFEEAVVGMALNEKKNVTIPVDKAYGQRNEEMVLTIPRDQVPTDINPEVGLRLQMQGPGNTPVMVEVTEVEEEHVKLDANPPLAGKDLIFDIELVEIS